MPPYFKRYLKTFDHQPTPRNCHSEVFSQKFCRFFSEYFFNRTPPGDCLSETRSCGECFLGTKMLQVTLVKTRHKIYRSSRPEVFCKKDILETFAKFTGQYLFRSLFLNKIAGLWRFPMNFAKV